MVILFDTREQKPFYCKRHDYARITLNVGDYTTAKLLRRFHVERKSPQDLYQTLTRGNVRFRKELIRAQQAGTRLVVLVETTKTKFINKDFPFGEKLQFPSDGLKKMIATFEKKYNLEFAWNPSRGAALNSLHKILNREEARHK